MSGPFYLSSVFGAVVFPGVRYGHCLLWGGPFCFSSWDVELCSLLSGLALSEGVRVE